MRAEGSSGLLVVRIIHGRKPIGDMRVDPGSAMQERVGELLVLRTVHEEGATLVLQGVHAIGRMRGHRQQYENRRHHRPENHERRPCAMAFAVGVIGAVDAIGVIGAIGFRRERGTAVVPRRRSYSMCGEYERGSSMHNCTVYHVDAMISGGVLGAAKAVISQVIGGGASPFQEADTVRMSA